MDEQYRSVLDATDNPGGASADAISEAEQTLGVVFPDAYRCFLETHGAAMGVGYEIAGVFVSGEDEPPMWQSIIAATNQMRRVPGAGLPDTLLPISGDGASLTYYLDASNRERSPVIAYGPGFDGVTVAESFEEFVVKLARGGLNA